MEAMDSIWEVLACLPVAQGGTLCILHCAMCPVYLLCILHLCAPFIFICVISLFPSTYPHSPLDKPRHPDKPLLASPLPAGETPPPHSPLEKPRHPLPAGETLPPHSPLNKPRWRNPATPLPAEQTPLNKGPSLKNPL